MLAPQGLLYFNARLRMLEKRQQQIQELKSKHDRLKAELEEAKSWLMLHPSRWSGECEYELQREGAGTHIIDYSAFRKPSVTGCDISVMMNHRNLRVQLQSLSLTELTGPSIQRCCARAAEAAW